MATAYSSARSKSRSESKVYLWHKHASLRWLTARETTLQEKTRGALAVIQSPDRKQLRLEVSSSSRALLQSLRDEFGGAIARLPRNWLQRFVETEQIKPLRIGNRLTIQSRRKVEQLKTRELVIPAVAAFGTGAHATTAMCLRLLERTSRNFQEGWSVLDAGTGTGILALAARAFGAKYVTAVDSDPRAIEIAKNNARLNRVDRVQFEIADATKYRPRRKLDVIIANLFSELIIAAIPVWKPRLKTSGILILSGILRAQEREVVRRLHKLNFAIEEIRRRGKWIAILARRQKAS
jgi:ribosomal protein L11 methyltransferase